MNWETGEEDGTGWGGMVARDREEENLARQHERAEKKIIDLTADILLIWRTAMPISVLADGKTPDKVALVDRIVELLRCEERCAAIDAYKYRGEQLDEELNIWKKHTAQYHERLAEIAGIAEDQCSENGDPQISAEEALALIWEKARTTPAQ